MTFIDYVKKFDHLSDDKEGLIKALLVDKTFQSNEFFIEAGQYCNHIAYVREGIFRIFFYDKDGNEIVRYFISENQFIVDLNAYENMIQSSEYIQAITKAEVTLLSRESLSIMSKEIEGWDKTLAKITQQALLEKLQNRSELVNQDAQTKYLDFISKNPHVVNRIPLGHLASYLGIKQQSLSRIRKNIHS